MGKSLRTLGLGIVGCGEAALHLHAPALRRVASVRVTSVFDTVPQQGHLMANSFKDSKLSGSVDELLAHPQVEAVAILTPPATHFELARRAIGAGKHVLVEKPLALEVTQAEELVSLARESGLTCAVGFHLRNHRLVRRARAMLLANGIGQVRAASTLWCTRLRPRRADGGWREQPLEGGALLDDLGIHHVDLLRYLLDGEIRDVRASIRDEGPTGRHVRLSLGAANGASLDITLVEGRFEWQEVELVGERGRIRLSLYDAWGFEALSDQTPVFGVGARLGRMFHSLGEAPAGLRTQLQGGDLHLAYVEQWRRFADAATGQGEAAANFADGLASLRVTHRAQDEALARSARKESSQEILLRPAMVKMDATAELPAEVCVYAPPGAFDGPPISVVLASPDEFQPLRATLRHLQAQTAKDQMELVLVAPETSSFDIDPALTSGFLAVRVVRLPKVRSIAQANAAGAKAARGRIVAFAEDHCFPEPTWAEALISAHCGEHAVVGPVVRNANPGTWISWADFIAGYGPWADGAERRDLDFLPGHNSSYKREVLEDLGSDLEGMLESETHLHQLLAQDGCSLHVEPKAVVSHVNFALLNSWADAQFLNGRMFAGTRCRHWGAGKRFLYFAGSPAIPLVRIIRAFPTLMSMPSNWTMKAKTFLGLCFGMCVDGVGQTLGYLAGPGSAGEKLARLEFHRFRHIPPEERETLFP